MKFSPCKDEFGAPVSLDFAPLMENRTFQMSVQEVVGRWAAQQEKELKMLSRADGTRLFSNLTRGNYYLVQAEGYLNNSGSGQTSEMALTWNRTLPGGSVSICIVK